MSEMDDEALIAAFQSQITLVKDAIRQVDNGEIPDVSAMEDEVDQLCGRASSCAPENVKSLRALMAILIDSLETLARRIKEQHDRNSAPS